MEENRGQKIYKIIMLVIITALITAMITTIVIYQFGFGSSQLTTTSDNTNLTVTLANFKKIIDKYYLGDVNEEELKEGAIKGYIAGLGDEYSEYFTKEEMEDYTETTLGNFVGIGVYMTKDTEKNAIRVLAPIMDTPADKAGILPGDIITKVDGVSYNGDQMTEASNKIKGEVGTTVKLEILRDGETKEFEVTRENIKVYHIESKMLENQIGYLRISTFDEGCAEEFKTKYEELASQGAKSLIIDLRNNGGGIVDEALEIADYMTDKGSTLLITMDKNGKEEIRKAKQDKLITMPVVVLTNENTASSSEILAGALKDNGVCKIVGTKTYGKGVIQELMTLQDGSGLKLTTNEYYTPNRNKINKVGIEPDEVVELPEEYKNELVVPEEQDIQLKRAIELVKE